MAGGSNMTRKTMSVESTIDITHTDLKALLELKNALTAINEETKLPPWLIPYTEGDENCFDDFEVPSITLIPPAAPSELACLRLVYEKAIFSLEQLNDVLSTWIHYFAPDKIIEYQWETTKYLRTPWEEVDVENEEDQASGKVAVYATGYEFSPIIEDGDKQTICTQTRPAI